MGFISVSTIFLIIAITSNLFLAFLVLRLNRHSATNLLYGLLSITLSIWLAANYVSVHPAFLEHSLWLIRLSIFLATPMSLLFFLLAYTIPDEKIRIPKNTLLLILLVTAMTMLFNLSEYAFVNVEIVNGSPRPSSGPGLLPFAILSTGFSILAIYYLIKKYLTATGEAKAQYKLITYGMLCMLGLLILTVLLPVVLFKFNSFVPVIPLYALIFLGTTAYAIVKHRLFDAKVIATEALVIILWMLLLARMIVSQTNTDRVIDGIILTGTIIFGIFLVRSVQREVRQREQLERLSTNLEAANVQLKQLDQARADFITIASHQLRTPPATIKWYLSAIKSGDYGPLDKGVIEALTKTEVTNNNLISLIDDMLNASRIERGKMEFLFEPVDIDAIAQNMVEQMLPQAKMKELLLSYDKPSQKPPLVQADREKIRQVINNFIDNAIKYTPKGGITVKVITTDTDVKVLVTDTGKGMDAAIIPSLFEKYMRGKDSVTHATGIGIGLYVAKVVVENHKGQIGATSTGVGKGSTFWFSLPLHNNLPKTKIMDLTVAGAGTDGVK